MASAVKPTAVHFSLIFFVMLSIIMSVMFVLYFRDYGDLEEATKVIRNDLRDKTTVTQGQDEDIQALSKVIGHNFDQVGLEDQAVGTVLGGTRIDLEKVDNLSEKTYKAAIEKLLQDVLNLTQERDNIRADLGAEHKEILALQSRYQALVDEEVGAKKKAEQDLKDLITQQDEALREKIKKIDDLRDANRQLQQELEDESIAHQKDNKRFKREVAQLSLITDRLREKLDEATKVSFERADGEIVWVDNITNRVWINLGIADNLSKRTNFSVYTKAHHGVGRGTDDIKGSIEVTRLIDSHTAEARILEYDLLRPLAKGDPIYTPLWSPGRTENFSFVGTIDLNGDGSSDRGQLHDLVAGARATIDNEVDDKGNRIRYTSFPNVFLPHQMDSPGIDVNTKFLVIGEIKDPSTTAMPDEKSIIDRILAHRTAMVKEARKTGVRVVSISDFLSYIGYKPQRRLFTPGTDRPYNLRAGAHSTTTDVAVGKRASSGQVSGVFGKRRRLRQKSSSGQTSPLFRGGY